MPRPIHAVSVSVAVLGVILGLAWWWVAGGDGRAGAPVASEAPAESSERAATTIDASQARPVGASRRPIAPTEPEASPTSPRGEEQSPVLVAGRVLDPHGVPVARARIFELTRRTKLTLLTESGPDGTLRLEGPSDRLRPLVARHDTWVESELFPWSETSMATRDEIVLRLRLGGRITGRVIDAAGGALSGFAVVWHATPVSGRHRTPQRAAETDAAGRFVLERVVPGPGLVGAMPLPELTREQRDDPEVAFAYTARCVAESVRVEDGDELAVELQQAPRASVLLFGRVLGPDGPIAGAEVMSCRRLAGDFGIRIRTRSLPDGRYEVRLPGAGEYIVGLDHESVRENGGAQEFDGMIDTILAVRVPVGAGAFEHDLLISTGAVGGRLLRPDGSPVSSGTVLLQGAGPDISTALSMHQADVIDGRFLFADVPVGSYYLNSLGPGGLSLFGPVQVVPGRSVDMGDLRLPESCGLKIKAHDAAGNDVVGAQFLLFDASGRPLFPMPMRLDGTGHVLAGIACRGSLVAWIGSSACSSVVSFDAEPGQVKEVELTLRPGGRLVVSTSVNGSPVVAGVLVSDANGVQVSGPRRQELFRHARPLGEAWIEPLAPGSYHVEVRGMGGERAEGTVELRPGQEEVRLELAFD